MTLISSIQPKGFDDIDKIATGYRLYIPTTTVVVYRYHRLVKSQLNREFDFG